VRLFCFEVKYAWRIAVVISEFVLLDGRRFRRLVAASARAAHRCHQAPALPVTCFLCRGTIYVPSFRPSLVPVLYKSKSRTFLLDKFQTVTSISGVGRSCTFSQPGKEACVWNRSRRDCWCTGTFFFGRSNHHWMHGIASPRRSDWEQPDGRSG